MKVLELAPAARVLWEVVGGPGEWIGTKVSFELAPGSCLTFLVPQSETDGLAEALSSALPF